jgi:hypothetical protein
MLSPKAKAAIIAVVVIVVVVGVALGAFFGTKSSKSSKPGPMFPPYVPNSGSGSGSGSDYHSGSHVPGSVSVSTGSFGSSGSSFGSSGSSFGSSFGSSGSAGSAFDSEAVSDSVFGPGGFELVGGAAWDKQSSTLTLSQTSGIHSRRPIAFPWKATLTITVSGATKSSPNTITIGFGASPLAYDTAVGMKWTVLWLITTITPTIDIPIVPYSAPTLTLDMEVDSDNILTLKANNLILLLPQTVLQNSYFIIGCSLSSGATCQIQIA